MRSSAKRFVSILIAALMFIAAIFVYGNLVSPAYEEVKNLRAELSSRSGLAGEQELAIEQIQALLKEYQDISSIESTIGMMLPLSQDAAFGLSQITGLAAVNNLDVESLSVNKMANRPSSNAGLVKGVGVLRFSVLLTGGYDDFKSFLRAAETNISLIDLVNLKIESSQGARAGSNNFVFSADMDTYYQTN